MGFNAVDILKFLEDKNLLDNKPLYWWPNAGTFEVVIGAVLTQNTTWKNVEKSLLNLKDFLHLEKFLILKEDEIKQKIKPSGFYNQKSKRLYNLARDIKKDFEDFDTFAKKVTREWLLSKKGIGEESADSILCYGCFRDEMVIDAYTKRLLKKFDIEFKKYSQYKSFLQDGIKDSDILKSNYKNDLNLCFARFHGMIVEYNKRNKI